MTKFLPLTTFTLVAITLFVGCQNANNSKAQEIDTNQNIEVVKKYHEIWSNGNVEELDKIIDPNFTGHFIGGFEYKGVEGAKKCVLETRNAFPDWKEELVDIIAQGNKVVTRHYSTGTHLGTWDGVDSTGNKVEIYEAEIYHLEKGKIVEQWGFWDEIKLKKQMALKASLQK
jgi:predicted ester cyclase